MGEQLMVWVFLLTVFVLAFVGTAWLRRYALARELMDVPNARSSHVVPTPRGGGLAVVIAFEAALLAGWGMDFVDGDFVWGLGGAGALVALLGFLDDHGHIPAKWRLAGHFLASGWLLFSLGTLPPVGFGDTIVLSGIIAWVFFWLYLVWMLNLYNFMDGIDGIAGVEAVTVCLGGALISWLAGMAGGALLPLLFGVAMAGFLVWNLPPARIFMGDVGSGFAGLVLGGLSLCAMVQAPHLFWAWLILLGVFIVDATVTLLRRMLAGYPPHQAHRSHGYQYASRRFRSHRVVTLAVGVINVMWLLPLAVLVSLDWLPGLIGLVIAYVPLACLAWLFRSGDVRFQDLSGI
ncbi:glycosyltransferase WbpL [Marinobacter lipolyticus SM19]|uniref:Glycosyltransferase WbpL n=1 Tax=Marinobacter lipolyticus SM19 TaxID=1318628 RepID=R8B5W5_9GAMM|nr:glycosyltransferase family 4 protein [Marinobacter lipolyticus]EON93904.1 glycosyltransferase WbpL [Marinobacter lipolyticus SM19]